MQQLGAAAAAVSRSPNVRRQKETRGAAASVRPTSPEEFVWQRRNMKLISTAQPRLSMHAADSTKRQPPVVDLSPSYLALFDFAWYIKRNALLDYLVENPAEAVCKISFPRFNFLFDAFSLVG